MDVNLRVGSLQSLTGPDGSGNYTLTANAANQYAQVGVLQFAFTKGVAYNIAGSSTNGAAANGVNIGIYNTSGTLISNTLGFGGGPGATIPFSGKLIPTVDGTGWARIIVSYVGTMTVKVTSCSYIKVHVVCAATGCSLPEHEYPVQDSTGIASVDSNCPNCNAVWSSTGQIPVHSTSPSCLPTNGAVPPADVAATAAALAQASGKVLACMLDVANG